MAEESEEFQAHLKWSATLAKVDQASAQMCSFVPGLLKSMHREFLNVGFSESQAMNLVQLYFVRILDTLGLSNKPIAPSSENESHDP